MAKPSPDNDTDNKPPKTWDGADGFCCRGRDACLPAEERWLYPWLPPDYDRSPFASPLEIGAGERQKKTASAIAPAAEKYFCVTLRMPSLRRLFPFLEIGGSAEGADEADQCTRIDDANATLPPPGADVARVNRRRKFIHDGWDAQLRDRGTRETSDGSPRLRARQPNERGKGRFHRHGIGSRAAQVSKQRPETNQPDAAGSASRRE